MATDGPERLQFGAFEIDRRTKELRKRGRPVRLPLQAFRVLEFLATHPGELITREQIRHQIWADDTFVDFEHGINKSIRQIRGALLDHTEAPKYIETLPRRGYRVIGEVKEAGLQPMAREASDSNGLLNIQPAEGLGLEPAASTRWPASKTRTIWWTFVIPTAVMLLAVALIARQYAHVPPSALRPTRIVPFTTFPGGEYEPAFSPDGSRIAFVWGGDADENYDIYVKTISSGAMKRLTGNPAGEGSPAWSPDGRSIAFVRYSASEGENGVFIVPAVGGPERRLTSIHRLDHIFDTHLDWSPDGERIAVVDKAPGEESFSIFLVSASTGNKQRLTFPPAGSVGDTGPRFAPDGACVAFRRSTGAQMNDLYSVRLDGRAGAPQRLTSSNGYILNHAWLPTGRELIYSDLQAFWRVAASGGTPLPVVGLPGGANFIAVSKQGDRIAYSLWFADTNIWRLPLGGSGATGGPKALIQSTRDERSAQYSPDGKMIAFRSDRSGSSEIWMCDAEGNNAVQLTSFGGPLTGTPRWSPDGLQIAFDSRPQGNSDVYVVHVGSGAVRRVTYDAASDAVPSWSSDGRWIYFASNRSGKWQVWKIRSVSSERDSQAVPVTHEGGFAPFESVDGETIYYAKGRDVGGLWQVRVGGGTETPLLPQLKAGYWGYWAPVNGRIYFIDAQSQGATVYAHLLDQQRTEAVAKLPKAPPYGDSGFSVSPDSRWIIYSQVDHSSSDIMLAEIR